MLKLNQMGIATAAAVMVMAGVAGGAVGTPVAVDSMVDQQPGDPLYGLERAGESIKEATYAGGQDWQLDRARERVQEFKNKARNGNADRHREVLNEAGERLSKAMKKSGDAKGLERASQAIRHNIQVLENAKELVPENARGAIERAITRSKIQEKALEQTKEKIENGKTAPGLMKEELENQIDNVENLIEALENRRLPPGILKEALEDRDISLENLKTIINGRNLPPGILKEILDDIDVPNEELEEFVEGKDLPPGTRKEILEEDDETENENEDDEYEDDEGEPEDFVHERGEMPDWMPGSPPWAGENEDDEEGEDEVMEEVGYELADAEVKIENPPASYKINPVNDENVNGENVVREVKQAFETWDSHTSTELFADNVTVTGKSGFERDGENVISFAPLEDSEKVSMTKLWYEDGEVLEFDIMFNSNLDWGIDPDGEDPKTISAYDIQNIATHEAGHVLSLEDLDDEDHAHLTMYHQSEIGSTNKISLEDGDINGLQTLYGE